MACSFLAGGGPELAPQNIRARAGAPAGKSQPRAAFHEDRREALRNELDKCIPCDEDDVQEQEQAQVEAIAATSENLLANNNTVLAIAIEALEAIVAILQILQGLTRRLLPVPRIAARFTVGQIQGKIVQLRAQKAANDEAIGIFKSIRKAA